MIKSELKKELSPGFSSSTEAFIQDSSRKWTLILWDRHISLLIEDSELILTVIFQLNFEDWYL